jgi:hypothetical protein
MVGEGLSIALQSPVAQITVFKHGAIRIRQAVTGHGNAGALALVALVSNGTRVLVVTVGRVEQMLAAPKTVAGIVSARIAVITGNGRPDTDTGRAMVSNGAGIAVQAFSAIQLLVATARLTVAQVLGTGVAIIAQRQKLSPRLVRLVHEAIAIVIQAIAGLHGRGQGITVAQSTLLADPLPATTAKFVAPFTRGRQAQLHRVVCARADARIGHALLRFHTIHRERFHAREAPGAVGIGRALRPAKTTLIPISEADIIRPTRALAVPGLSAGFAQVGHSRDANKGQVRAGTNLLAAPSWRAFFTALDGAHALAHVLHAKA